MKKLLLLLSFVVISCYVSAQNSKLDSLQSVYQNAKTDTSKILTLIEIAHEFRNSNADTTIVLSTQALEKAEKIDFSKGKARAYYTIGFSQSVKGKYTLALENAQKSLSFFEKIEDNKGIGNSLNLLGNIYYNQGDYSKAFNDYSRSLAIREKMGDQMGISASLNNIGGIYSNQGDYPKALEYHQRSLSIKEKMGDQMGISASLNNIGTIYFNQGNYAKALEYHQRSLSIKEKMGDQLGISASFNNIGTIYFNQGNYADALEYHYRSLTIKEKIGDQVGISASLNNIGEVYIKQGNSVKALEAQQRSLLISEKIGDQNGITYALLGIAQSYQRQGKYELSVESALKGLKIAQEMGGLLETKEAQKILYESYKLKGEANKALEYHEKYKISNDSLFNVEKSKKIQSIETIAQLEKKDLQIQKEKESINYQQNIIFIVSGGLAMVLLLALLIFRSQQTERRAKDLLSQKNEELLLQKEDIQKMNEFLGQANKEIQIKRDALEEKNKEVTDSITYAQRIQQAILPLPEEMHAVLPQHFVLFKPRDIVSGDFYYCQPIQNKIVLAAIDCTGHGVPGAFMSMLGKEILDKVVIEREIVEADKILNELHKGIRKVLKQSKSDNTDGMDMSLLVIDKQTKNVEFSAARNPLIYITDNQLYLIKGDKMPIGGELLENDRMFTKHVIELPEDSGYTTFYLFSDGFQDQFGGPRRKKFMIAQLKDILLDIHQKDMQTQREILNQHFEDWIEAGNERQIDDVLLMGVRI